MSRRQYNQRGATLNPRELATLPHIRESLERPVPHEEQKTASIRELEKERGPVVGRWTRSLAMDQTGLHFRDGSTVVLEKLVHPHASWEIAAEPRELPQHQGHPAGPRTA